METFIVKQERGQDSYVEVYSDLVKSWPHDKQALIFTSEQSMTTNSERAWNVCKAIEGYATERGYRKQEIAKNQAIYIYDASHHSNILEYQLREQVKADTRYQAKLDANRQIADTVNREYGVAMQQLKNLVKLLEDKNRAELKQLNQELIATQLEILSEMDIPNEINEANRMRLFEPSYSMQDMEIDHYRTYTKELPTSLDSILSLLD